MGYFSQLLDRGVRAGLEAVAVRLGRKVVIQRAYPLEDGKEEVRPYLFRYYVAQGWWGSLFLHHIVDSDNGPETHNHPWLYSASLILAGGYIEERVVGRVSTPAPFVQRPPVTQLRELVPLDINFITHQDYHRLQVNPEVSAWTLFYHTPKRIQRWGFLYPNGEFEPVLTKMRGNSELVDPKASSEDDE